VNQTQEGRKILPLRDDEVGVAPANLVAGDLEELLVLPVVSHVHVRVIFELKAAAWDIPGY
jgi:hypothetical protein